MKLVKENGDFIKLSELQIEELIALIENSNEHYIKVSNKRHEAEKKYLINKDKMTLEERVKYLENYLMFGEFL